MIEASRHRALGAQPARFQSDYGHHTVEATRLDLVQQPFETIIPIGWAAVVAALAVRLLGVSAGSRAA
ncbi:hypothetical protein ACFOWZ_37335 [Lentzea rhizosphaerae]|uniref:Uncharacterized protein n=1 Tax=Lentzea rhizosphaerae TaxID=2041025 RepID=A0ABV8C582_9PSEU